MFLFSAPSCAEASYSYFQEAGLPVIGALSGVTWALRAGTHEIGPGLTALEATHTGACNHFQETSFLIAQVTWASCIGTHAGRSEKPLS